MERSQLVNNSFSLIFFSTIISYAYPLFYSCFSISGISRPSWALPLYAMVIIGCSFFIFVRECYYLRFRITKREGLIIIIILWILMDYLFVWNIYGSNPVAIDTMKDFLARSVPAVLIAIVAAKEVDIKTISKGLDYVLIVFAICSFRILCLSILRGYSTSSWEEVFFYDYQSASYMAAYTVGIGLYKLFIQKNNTVIKKTVYVFAIITCMILSIYSGGRGGVVLCIIYVILLCCYFAFIEKKATKLLGFLAIGLTVSIFLFNYLLDNSQLLMGLTRAFEFVGSSGINWEGTSGRLDIYKDCLDLIRNRPLFGYGITGAPNNGIVRSHNIVLDILIDGGMVYLFVWIVIWITFFRYVFVRMKQYPEYALLVSVFIGDFVMLSFSGVYMRTSAMWFAVTYAFVEQK